MKRMPMAILVLLLCIGPMLLYAQTQTEPLTSDTLRSYEIDEMVVTGTRTLKRIIDIPYSVERISNSDYRYERKNSVSDVLSGTPGLFFQNRYGNHDVRISIRGFGSRSNSGIRGVRILLDDIPESEPDGQTRIEAIDFHSVGRIEIVKGNASSLYTNAPGGVINFINDIEFTESHIILFNDIASFKEDHIGLIGNTSFGIPSEVSSHNNGFKLAVKGDGYKFLTTYTNHSSDGYRPHSNDHWDIVNSVYETHPNELAKLTLLLYFVDGRINLPGSLTQQQYDTDPFMGNPRDLGRDAMRVSKKGRLGIRYNTLFGSAQNNELELTGYGTIKYFERTAATYRFINRNGVGGTGRWIHKNELFGLPVELSLGADVFHQYGPIEEYQNYSGVKGEPVDLLTDETIDNVGAYFTATVSVIPDRMDLLITGRHDAVVFDQVDRNLGIRDARREFAEFTPKVSLNYKFTPAIAVYSSYGYSFDSPAGNELENYPLSSNYPKLINPDLQPQYSRNAEIGVKGTVMNPGDWFTQSRFELVLFNSRIKDEIVPFAIGTDIFYRNAAETNRTGVEAGVSTTIITGLTTKLAYTFSDFSYTSYSARTLSLTGSVVNEADFSGNEVPSVPKHNMSAAVSYQTMLADNITGFARTSVNYISGMYVNDANAARSPDYSIVGMSLGTDIVLGRMNVLVSCGINNILDRRHVAFININSDDRKDYYEAGEPRNYFLSLNLGYTL